MHYPCEISGLEADLVLEAVGRDYHDHRTAMMTARNEGMTESYNRFHDRHETAVDIVGLRELHEEMDRAVLRAYGWDDLARRAEPQFLDERNEDDHKYQGRLFWPGEFRDEMLSRLLALNAERASAERAAGPSSPHTQAKQSPTRSAELELSPDIAADEDG